MLRIVMQRKELGKLLHLLYQVFDIRMTFFDAEGRELDLFDIKGMSDYCAAQRRNKKFDQRCGDCDRRYLRRARETGINQVYRCHAGLIEGVVPLRDEQARFLGAIVFGQLRPRDESPHCLTPALAKRYHALPESTLTNARNMAQLLQYTSESIIKLELVRYRNPNWAEALEGYIDAHLSEKITITEMASLVGRSSSYISHHFKAHFGSPPNEYIRAKRIARAKELLRTEATLARIAQSCGFYDEFHLSNSFKSATGKSPKQFRRTELNK